MKFIVFLIFFIIDLMQFSHEPKKIDLSRHTHYFNKRVLTEAPTSLDRTQTKFTLFENYTSRPPALSLAKALPLWARKCNRYQPKRSLSVLSEPNLLINGEVPAKAIQIDNLVNKKKRALRIKYQVKDSSDPVPNLLEIRESVKKEEVSFMRRMDKQLNTTGNAFLLTHLREDLHIQFHNYLKEALTKTRKNRKYLINHQKNPSTERFVILQCQLPKESTVNT